MAQRNLLGAAEAVERQPDRARELGIDAEEAAGWRDAADAMLIPYDAELEVHPQAEEFTEHAVWDFAGTAEEQYPLLLHFPYFDLYRKQVVKQADLVMALFRRGDAFTAEEKARDFAYYEALTVRDSSLSACIQAVVAAEVGHLDLAYDYFAEAALLDLADTNHNTRDGIHLASLAGAWIAAVCGFGGMRDHGGSLSFTPRLPQALSRLSFRVCFNGRRLQVGVGHGEARYSAARGRAARDHAPRRGRDRHAGRRCRSPDPAGPRPSRADAAAGAGADTSPASGRPALSAELRLFVDPWQVEVAVRPILGSGRTARGRADERPRQNGPDRAEADEYPGRVRQG